METGNKFKTALNVVTTLLKREVGFSLLEVLIVTFLVGLLSSVVVFSLVPSDGLPRQEGKVFLAKLNAAQEYSLMSGKPVGIFIDNSGYQFLIHRKGEWEKIVKNRKLKSKTWKEGVIPNLLRNETQINLAESENENQFPLLVIIPGGEITPFEISFEDGSERVTLKQNSIHEFQLVNGR